MANRFDQIIDAWDPLLRRAFLDSFYQVRNAAQIEQIARMLERGDVDGALRAVGLNPASFRPLDRTMEHAFEAGGNAIAKTIPGARLDDGSRLIVQFNIRNPVAERWLRDHSSALIRDILADQRTMVRQHLQAGMTQGLNPRTAALDLVGRINPQTGRREGGVIGLTTSQAEWVRKYAGELASDNPSAALKRSLRDKRFDAAVRKAAETGEPIPADLRASMVAAYKNRALRHRAEAIARTEAMAALHQAQEEAIRQAVDSGAVSSDAIAFVWRTARDKRVRDSHAAMDGQEVARGERFRTGAGALLRYPGDPQGPASEVIGCRCWREPRVDFLAGVE